MLNITFKKQNGPDMDLYLISDKDQSLVVSALSVRGYIVAIGKQENPWEVTSFNTLNLVTRNNTGTPLLLAPPESSDGYSEDVASLAMEAINLYSPNLIESRYKAIHRPIHYDRIEEF